MDAMVSPHLVPLAGLVLGVLFGFAVQRSDYCAMGAVSDILLMGDWRRMRSWLLAIAVAILGTQALMLIGAVDLDQTPYLQPGLAVAGAVAGGLLFGFGMTLTGGCISKNLVRLGGGNLRALVVIMVVAIAALATMAGPLVWLWHLFDALTIDPGRRFPRQDLPALLGLAAGLRMLLAAMIAAVLAWFCLREPTFRSSRALLLAGLTLGALVPLGWLATTWLADPWAPVPIASLGFVGPSASSLILLTTGGAPVLPFGVALIAGTILGGLVGAGTDGRLRLEGFADAHDLRRNLGGAAAMGVGGVLSGGCTVGQGLSGVSTLGLGSVVAVGAIVAGAVAGIRMLEAGSVRGALRALVAGG